MKNALSFGRRRSASEEQNLLGSSQEQTDKETEDEGGMESQDETDRLSQNITGVKNKNEEISSLKLRQHKLNNSILNFGNNFYIKKRSRMNGNF